MWSFYQVTLCLDSCVQWTSVVPGVCVIGHCVRPVSLKPYVLTARELWRFMHMDMVFQMVFTI